MFTQINELLKTSAFRDIIRQFSFSIPFSILGGESYRKEFTLPEANSFFNPIALRKAKIVCNFGLSECNRVNSKPIFNGFITDGSKQEVMKVISLRKIV